MKVRVYSTPTCPWCNKLKDWLKKKKVEFEDIDITETQNAKFRDEMIEKSGQMAIPVTEIGDKIIVGFKEKELQKALDKAKP
ncbi:MAG TPA: glutaredoxin domain-containing protein [Candidatus Nanoarchaeia archaeon]|nr:glutaredoxin domain-containing protein [Candidatus Nanoarchaeia archaeon]